MYLVVNDFRGGLDVRKSLLTAPAGTLQKLKNAHINRGGEIEQRKAFSVYAELLVGTSVGLLAASDTLYVFGSGPASAQPAGIERQRLDHPIDAAAVMTELVDATVFNGKVWAIARFDNGDVLPFYDGVAVADFYRGLLLSSSGLTATAVRDRFLSDFLSAGATAYTIESSGTNAITITGLPDQAFSLTTTLHRQPGSGADIVFADTRPASTGVAQIVTVFIGGTWAVGDKLELVLTGTSSDPDRMIGAGRATGVVPSACITLAGKMHVIAGANWLFSAVDLPTRFNSGTGAGVVELSNNYAGSETLVGLAIYQNNLAFFSRRAVQVWSVDPDPALQRQLQVMNNIGTFAKNSLVSFGDSDVLFLSDTGVRSLRARDSSNFAAVSDIGSPVDDEINPLVRGLDDASAAACHAALEPMDGRYLLAIGSKLYVFSFFYASKVSAWSTYEITGVAPDAMAQLGNRLFVRAGHKIYLYGGADNDTYDADEVEAVLPYLAADKPGTPKSLRGFDAAMQGQWTVELGMDASALGQRDRVAVVGGATFGLEAIAVTGDGTHFGLRLTKASADRGVLSNMLIHFETGEQGD